MSLQRATALHFVNFSFSEASFWGQRPSKKKKSFPPSVKFSFHNHPWTIRSSGNVFLSGPGGLRFKSWASQISRKVANGLSPLRHFFERAPLPIGAMSWRWAQQKLVTRFGEMQRVQSKIWFDFTKMRNVPVLLLDHDKLVNNNVITTAKDRVLIAKLNAIVTEIAFHTFIIESTELSRIIV